MPSEQREYEYSAKWMSILFGIFFFGGCAVVLGVEALSNRRGLLIEGIIKLSPAGATIFYWVLFVASIGFVSLFGLIGVHRAVIGPRRVVLSRTSLVVPKSWSSDEKSIDYDAIKDVKLSKVKRQRFLKVMHAGGKYTIIASHLPSNSDFEELCDLLARNVAEARSQGRR